MGIRKETEYVREDYETYILSSPKVIFHFSDYYNYCYGSNVPEVYDMTEYAAILN